MKPWLKLLIAAVLLAGLAFFMRATDWKAVGNALQRAGTGILGLLAISFVSALTAVWSWRQCMPSRSPRVSSDKLFWIRLIGENIAVLNPASIVGGEAAKVYLLQQHGMAQRDALQSVVLARAMMILSQLTLWVVAMAWFFPLLAPHLEGISWKLSGTWLILPLALIFTLWLFIRWHWANMTRTATWWVIRLQKAGRYVKELGKELRQFFKENRRGTLLAFLYCCWHWIIGAMEFFLILALLDMPVTVPEAVLIDLGVVVFKTAGAFVPGQIGVEEYGNKVMLAVVGVQGAAVWITVSVLRRFRQLFWMGVAFSVYFLFYNKKSGQRKEGL